MVLSLFANEEQLVNEFVSYTHTNALTLSNGERRKLFVWGNEIWLQDGKGGNRAGILDLLATDETGEVWLIEAKLCSNPELCSKIWHSQIELYRKSLMKQSEDSIVLASRQYLLGLKNGVILFSYLQKDTQNLFEAFQQWVLYNGLPLENAEKLYNGTLQKLKSGELIATVLADVYSPEVWETRSSSLLNGGYAYIVHNRDDTCAFFDCLHLGISYETAEFAKEKWSQLIRKKYEIVPRPDTIGLYLADPIVGTYNEIVTSLRELGWDGKGKSNKKAFIFDLPTIYEENIRVHIGWVDADGSLDISYRTLHHFGLKFNIDFRFMKRNPGTLEVCKVLINEMITKANYSIRGSNISVRNVHDLSDSDFNKWDGEMYRRRDAQNRDYIGRAEEGVDCKAVLGILRSIVAERSSGTRF